MSKIANIDDFDMIITDDKLESDIHVKNIIKHIEKLIINVLFLLERFCSLCISHFNRIVII